MTTMQRKNGMHHKTREFPVGELVTFILLFIAAVGILVGVSWVTSTQANAGTTGYLSPAVTAVRSLHAHNG